MVAKNLALKFRDRRFHNLLLRAEWQFVTRPVANLSRPLTFPNALQAIKPVPARRGTRFGQILDKGNSLMRDPATTLPTESRPLEGIDFMAMVDDGALIPNQAAWACPSHCSG